MMIEKLALTSKKASRELRSISHELRKKALVAIAHKLENNVDLIIKANQKDMNQAEQTNLNQALKDRLMLNEERILSMARGVLEISEQKEVVGEFYGEFTNEAGLKIKRQRVALGVILMIFESRPNVVVDCAALAIKSSNAIILKGGKEAKYSNEILGQLIQEALKDILPDHSVQVLASDSREQVNELLSLDHLIDVVIPRGGERLIEHVYKHAKMPVIAHFKGLCHMYIDKDADDQKAIDLIINAKTQRTGVCNAIETLLIHQDKLKTLTPTIIKELSQKGTELRVDSELFSALQEHSAHIKEASDQDWASEYLDNILSIKVMNSLKEAIAHIDQYGSYHTECIVSENKEAQDEFLKSVDASCIAVNASTRFNDGGQLGLGAELGISTSKIHAYGPMGAEQMTTSRFVIVGDGHTRA